MQLLGLFEQIYRTSNLTRAGAAMGLSQSGVSRGLSRLRALYGDDLFVRQSHGVHATPVADRLAQPLSAALAMLHATIDEPAFEAISAARVYRVAMSDIGERYFLPKLLEHLLLVAPHITVVAQSPPQTELLGALASGEIDLAMGFFPEMGKQVHLQRLFKERFVYIARLDHPTVQGQLTAAQVRRLPHVLGCPPGTRHATAVEKVLTSRAVGARVTARVNSFLAVGPIVATTNLVAAVPSNLARLVADHLRLQIIEPPVRVPGFDVTMTWHRRFHRDPSMVWLRAQLENLFRQT